MSLKTERQERPILEGQICLVTGGAGFIGSHLVERLVDNNEVRVIDDESTGHRQNLTGVADQITYQRGSILDGDLMTKLCTGVDFVFHLAALGSVPRSVADPLTSDSVNTHGTLQVLWAAKEAGVRRVIYSSSSSVYGDQPISPKEEGMVPAPISPYAVTKVTGERYAEVFTKTYGLATSGLRYFNVYGPRQDPNSAYAAVIPRFITSLKQGVPLPVYGDGRQTRDFTYVDDVVDANVAAALIDHGDSTITNVSGGRQVSIQELGESLAAAAGVRATFEHLPERPGDIRDSLASLKLAEKVLGYRPKVELAVGLQRTWEAFSSSG